MVQIPKTPPGASGSRAFDPLQKLQNELQQPKINQANEQYKTFTETLKGFVEDVNNLQTEAGRSVEKLLTGEIKDVHDVMVAVEKAGTSFELMMEIRNKMIDAYHEILRMQV